MLQTLNTYNNEATAWKFEMKIKTAECILNMNV